MRSSEYAQMPRIGLPSSLAHWISHFCPLEVSEFLLTSTITPWERRMRVRTLSFQSESYGSFTDMSMNSNGARGMQRLPLQEVALPLVLDGERDEYDLLIGHGFSSSGEHMTVP